MRVSFRRIVQIQYIFRYRDRKISFLNESELSYQSPYCPTYSPSKSLSMTEKNHTLSVCIVLSWTWLIIGFNWLVKDVAEVETSTKNSWSHDCNYREQD